MSVEFLLPVPAVIYSKLLILWARVQWQTFQDHCVLHQQPFLSLSLDMCASWKAAWVMSDWIRMSLYTGITDEQAQVKGLGVKLVVKQCCDRSQYQKKVCESCSYQEISRKRRGRGRLDDEIWGLHPSPDSHRDLWLKRETTFHCRGLYQSLALLSHA